MHLARLPRLSPALAADLGAAAPPSQRSRARIGVVHFGPGAFFRAHQAPVYDRLLGGGDLRWGVLAVSLHSAGVREALQPQDGLYTLVQLGEPDGVRVVGALREVVVAPDQPQAVRAALASPEVRLVGLTVTEKGYHLTRAGELDSAHPDVAHDLASGTAATFRTVYGWLAEGLATRHAAGRPPFLLLSSDNLPGNGTKLKRALCTYLRLGGRDALADWTAGELRCPDSMVDSITPATDDALRLAVASALGVHDAWPVQREAFWQWVVGDTEHPVLQDLAAAGVTLTHDVGAYGRAKLRLLNGAHSTLAYLGLLAGYTSVSEAMADPRLAAFIETFMRRDIVPTVRAPELDLPAYVDAVLGRFRNTAVRHRLVQIAADGSQKLPLRLGAAALDALRSGAEVERFAWPYAAWMRWVQSAGDDLADPLVADLRQASDEARGRDPAGAVAAFAARSKAVPPDLLADAGFRGALERIYPRLDGDDPLAALP